MLVIASLLEIWPKDYLCKICGENIHLGARYGLRNGSALPGKIQYVGIGSG